MSCCENSFWTLKCEGAIKSCSLCNQNVCYYHGNSNNNGPKGGHARCRVDSCSTSPIFRMNCEGYMIQCRICSDWYCTYHSQPVAAGTLTGGHNCNVTPRDPNVFVEETCLALAEIASLVYYVENINDPRTDEEIEAINHVKEEYGYELIPDSVRTDGVCHMGVFTNGPERRVLAVKGTTFTSTHDLKQDFDLFVGGERSVSASEATCRVASELINLYDVNLITGHSLGGYYAEIMATNNRICGVSFCNPGVNGPRIKLGGPTPIKGFQNINFEHDPLGNAYAGVYQHVQWSVYVEGTEHRIGGMVKYFSQNGRRTITNFNVVARSEDCPTGYYYPN